MLQRPGWDEEDDSVYERVRVTIMMNQYDVDDDNLPVPVVVIVFTKLATARNNPTPHLSARVRK